MAELEDVIKKDDVQIITITESWGQTWKEASLEIEGFNMYKKHRADGRRGGGCLIYVSKELKSYACKQMENVPGDDSVWCWVKIANGARILVGCIYRSPTSSVENNELIINQIVKASEVADQNRILLMGDFNVKEINWIEVEATGGGGILAIQIQ